MTKNETQNMPSIQINAQYIKDLSFERDDSQNLLFEL